MPSDHNVAKRPCRGASEQEDKGDRAENSEIDGLSLAVDYGGCSETADDWTIGWATGIDKDDDDLDECEEFEDEVDVWAGGHDRIEKRGQTLRTMYMIGRCRRGKHRRRRWRRQLHRRVGRLLKTTPSLIQTYGVWNCC
jgi:hypothetical protein